MKVIVDPPHHIVDSPRCCFCWDGLGFLSVGMEFLTLSPTSLVSLIEPASILLQIFGIGFAILNNMLQTMSTRYWLEIRLTWMRAKG
ncbi:hypothetical protein Godav_000320 [Gossypium davidsonii]|uniref:Uncharacterized protein n=1 Tax=Gossypium davidsonii TaxID=34287 RepID=A0A7J8SZ84_GOSDV|nr:hypothetical protein [Gossypium davidsonii]